MLDIDQARHGHRSLDDSLLVEWRVDACEVEVYRWHTRTKGGKTRMGEGIRGGESGSSLLVSNPASTCVPTHVVCRVGIGAAARTHTHSKEMRVPGDVGCRASSTNKYPAWTFYRGLDVNTESARRGKVRLGSAFRRRGKRAVSICCGRIIKYSTGISHTYYSINYLNSLLEILHFNKLLLVNPFTRSLY